MCEPCRQRRADLAKALTFVLVSVAKEPETVKAIETIMPSVAAMALVDPETLTEAEQKAVTDPFKCLLGLPTRAPGEGAPGEGAPGPWRPLPTGCPR